MKKYMDPLCLSTNIKDSNYLLDVDIGNASMLWPVGALGVSEM